MYHPDHTLMIAHDREHELLKDAQICGLPKTDAAAPNRYRATLAIAMLVALLTMGLRVLVG